ncbi:MAG: DNA-processing protein DprA [Pseudomonadales bacterium]
MAADTDRYHLAAVVHSLGRSRSREALAAAGGARAAFRRLQARRYRPEDLEAACRRHGLSLLTPADPAFPALLCAIPDPPPLLYVHGDTSALLRPTVAVVGARRCTRGGADVAAALAGSLAARGVTVVSGLARGIDTAAHRAAAAAGRTVAVIGSGLASPYPPANRGLVTAIIAGGGLLLSEYPPDAGARRHHFPERNRLISGLARGVVVVEAGVRSGSLITARMALEQGREVCAVPGSVVNPAARGCHRLLRQGAALVESADDVLDALGLTASPGILAPGVTGGLALEPGLAAICAAVGTTVTTLDEVMAATGLSGSAAAAALVELELSGFVRRVAGGYIRRPLA